MTAAQRTRLKQSLIALKAELSATGFEKIATQDSTAREVGDAEDAQPLNEMIQAVASGRNRNRAAVLKLVDLALTKIANDPDDFGVCEDCSEDIALPRLNAMPYVRFCVKCQGNRDAPRGTPRRKLTDYS